MKAYVDLKKEIKGIPSGAKVVIGLVLIGGAIWAYNYLKKSESTSPFANNNNNNANKNNKNVTDRGVKVILVQNPGGGTV